MTEYVVGWESSASYLGREVVAVIFDTETRETRNSSENLPGRAPDDVRALYKRIKRARANWQQRAKDIETARRLGLDHYSQAKRLRRAALSEPEKEAVEELLTTNFLSPFKSSLADQVRKWLRDENNEYRRPLSKKQFEALTRRSRR